MSPSDCPASRRGAPNPNEQRVCISTQEDDPSLSDSLAHACGDRVRWCAVIPADRLLDMAAQDQPAERPVAAAPTPDSVPTADSVTSQDSAPTLRSDRPLGADTTPESGEPPDVGTTPHSNQAPDLDTPSESDPSPALEKPAGCDPTLERDPAPRRRWFADTRRLRRDLLAFFLPPLLLLLVTAIVVTLGSGLLVLGSRELEIGPIVIAWAVVAAALGVLVIGSGALWLATRPTH